MNSSLIVLFVLTLIGLNNASMIAALFALTKTNNSVADLNREIFAFSDIASYSRQMVHYYTTDSNKRLKGGKILYGGLILNLSDSNISSLCGWNLRSDPVYALDIYDLDLSHNKLKKVSDQETSFEEDVECIDLSNNEISFVDFSKTKVKILVLKNNNLTDIAHIKFPLEWNAIHLGGNPIGSIENYQFSKAMGYRGWDRSCLRMGHCSITSLQNVMFDAKRVSLSNNPMKSMKNVTFRNCEKLSMKDCNITLSTLQTFEMAFIGERALLDLSGNKMSVKELKQINYTLPEGVRSITIKQKIYQ